MILNPFILENIIQSFSFMLIVLVCCLIALILFLLSKINSRSKTIDKTTEDLNMLSTMFMNANIPCIIIKPNGRIELINSLALQIFEKSREEMQGSFLEAFNIISASKKRTSDMINKLRNNERYEFNFVIKTKEHELPCTISVSELSTGKKIRYLLSLREMDNGAENRHDQNLLDERLNELETTIGLGYWVYNYETGETLWSRGLYNLLGAKVNKVKPDLSFVSLFKDKSSSKASDLLMAIKGKDEYRDRLKIEGYDKKIRDVDIVLKHQFNSDGDPERCMGILRDITETQRLLNQNEVSRLILNQVLNAKGICMVTTYPCDQIISLNDYALETLKVPIHDVIGKQFSKVFGKSIPIPDEVNLKAIDTFESHLPNNPEEIILWQKLKFKTQEDQLNSLYIGVNLTRSAKVLGSIYRSESDEENKTKN